MMDTELIVTKKLCKLPRLPHSLHTNYGREQARPSKVQTMVKTSLNVATTEILLPGAVMRERSANATTNWNGNFHQVKYIFYAAILSDFPCCKIDVNRVILMLFSQQQIFILICIGIIYICAETNTLLCYDVTGTFNINLKESSFSVQNGFLDGDISQSTACIGQSSIENCANKTRPTKDLDTVNPRGVQKCREQFRWEFFGAFIIFLWQLFIDIFHAVS